MITSKPVVLITDFDGTISKRDFFWFAIDEYLHPEDIQPWTDYKQGKITLIEALSRIFAKIRVDEEDFHKFILTLPIEKHFEDTVRYCTENNIPIHIVSAGADYYIKYILNHMNLLPFVKLLSNESYYSKEEGLKFKSPDKNSPYYLEDFGISKKSIVEEYKNKGYFCIYAGDGTPDFEAAKLADVVFARESLKKLCDKAGIENHHLHSYSDILNYLKENKLSNNQ